MPDAEFIKIKTSVNDVVLGMKVLLSRHGKDQVRTEICNGLLSYMTTDKYRKSKTLPALELGWINGKLSSVVFREDVGVPIKSYDRTFKMEKLLTYP